MHNAIRTAVFKPVLLRVRLCRSRFDIVVDQGVSVFRLIGRLGTWNVCSSVEFAPRPVPWLVIGFRNRWPIPDCEVF